MRFHSTTIESFRGGRQQLVIRFSYLLVWGENRNATFSNHSCLSLSSIRLSTYTFVSTHATKAPTDSYLSSIAVIKRIHSGIYSLCFLRIVLVALSLTARPCMRRRKQCGKEVDPNTRRAPCDNTSTNARIQRWNWISHTHTHTKSCASHLIVEHGDRQSSSVCVVFYIHVVNGRRYMLYRSMRVYAWPRAFNLNAHNESVSRRQVRTCTHTCWRAQRDSAVWTVLLNRTKRRPALGSCIHTTHYANSVSDRISNE